MTSSCFSVRPTFRFQNHLNSDYILYKARKLKPVQASNCTCSGPLQPEIFTAFNYNLILLHKSIGMSHYI
jgi:hypothetical protein